MTVVFGCVEDGRAWLAIDDAISICDRVVHSMSKRLVRHRVKRATVDGCYRDGGFVSFGVAGLGSAIQLHLRSWECPMFQTDSDESTDAFMNAVARSLRLHLRESGWPELKSDNDEALGGLMLVTFNGRLWIMDSCFGLIEVSDSVAIGSGGHMAHGVFLGSSMMSRLEERIEMAFNITRRHIPGVGGLNEMVFCEQF
jgi:hypothetical protein